jgi:hypothetical protein
MSGSRQACLLAICLHAVSRQGITALLQGDEMPNPSRQAPICREDVLQLLVGRLHCLPPRQLLPSRCSSSRPMAISHFLLLLLTSRGRGASASCSAPAHGNAFLARHQLHTGTLGCHTSCCAVGLLPAGKPKSRECARLEGQTTLLWGVRRVWGTQCTVREPVQQNPSLLGSNAREARVTDSRYNPGCGLGRVPKCILRCENGMEQ